MKYSGHKEIDRIVRDLVRNGWKFWRGGKHGRLRSPSGNSVLTVPVSPSCKNVAKTFSGEVKRALKAEELRQLAIHMSVQERRPSCRMFA